MAFDLLSTVSPASKHWKICVRIARMWDYTCANDQQPPIHVDLVLVDEKGNAMYAEIPGSEADRFKAILHESKVYAFSKFFVSPSKPAYKPFDNKYMIKFTPWTNVSEVTDIPADFPQHVFNLVPFSDLSLRVGMQEYFTDVIGMIVGVSKLAFVRMASNSSDTAKRVIALKDLSNCEVKLVLWGQRALDFDSDLIYDVGQDNAVVGIFVGTLMKAYSSGGPAPTYEETLSGGSACKWYLNEDIPEINAFFDSLTDGAPKIKWISTGTESYASARRSAQPQTKTVAELKRTDPWEADGCTFLCTVTIARLTPSQPWWFLSCSRCHKSALPYGDSYKCSAGCSGITATPKFRLCLIGTDGTDTAEFVLFGRIAQQVVGRTVMSLLKFGGKSENLPREIAAIVTQKFTFSVSINDKNVMQRNVSFQVNGIETSFGRQSTIPQIRDQGLFIEPSGSSSVAASDVTKDNTCSDIQCTPPDPSVQLVAVADEMPSGSKKRRAIIRHPLGAAKKLTFDDSSSKQEGAAALNVPSVDDVNAPVVPKQSTLSDEITVSDVPAEVGKDAAPPYADDKKKSLTSTSGSTQKPKTGPK